CGPVDVVAPQQERVVRGVVEAQHVVGRARGRGGGPVEVGGGEAAVGGGGLGALVGGGRPAQQGAGVHRADLGAGEGGAVGEHVVGDVVGVGPDAALGIVVEAGAERVGVTVPGAGGVRGLGDGDALHVGRGRDGELHHDPAVGHPVVHGDRVTAVVG